MKRFQDFLYFAILTELKLNQQFVLRVGQTYNKQYIFWVKVLSENLSASSNLEYNFLYVEYLGGREVVCITDILAIVFQPILFLILIPLNPLM